MTKMLLSLLFIATAAFTLPAQEAELDWHDVVRDVFFDGELLAGTQVLSSSSPNALAILSPKLDQAVVLKIDEKTVHTVGKEAFKFSTDRASATSDARAVMPVIGKFTRVEGVNSSFVYSFTVEGRNLVLRSHAGLTGEVTEAKVWETVPVWRSAMDQHTPDAKAVAQIKAVDKETSITILFGTWCGDSKYYVPRLLRALHEANNSRLKVKLIGIDNQFNQPLDVVQPRRLTNVPTVIVERGGREIGRIVETPATASAEEDLAAILYEKPLTHLGRIDKGPKLGHGVYSYRDAAGKESGKEEWDLYSTPDGGYLIRSVITTADLQTEVLHQLNAKKSPTFVEVTKRSGDNVTRARYNISDHQLSATMRGNTSGTVKQTLEIPKGMAVSSPSIAAEGWVASQVTGAQVSSYFVPREFVNATGTLGKLAAEAKSDETVKTPAGEFRAQHQIRTMGKAVSDWWLHPQLGVPVRGKTADGTEYVLTSLEITPKN